MGFLSTEPMDSPKDREDEESIKILGAIGQ